MKTAKWKYDTGGNGHLRVFTVYKSKEILHVISQYVDVQQNKKVQLVAVTQFARFLTFFDEPYLVVPLDTNSWRFPVVISYPRRIKLNFQNDIRRVL